MQYLGNCLFQQEKHHHERRQLWLEYSSSCLDELSLDEQFQRFGLSLELYIQISHGFHLFPLLNIICVSRDSFHLVSEPSSDATVGKIKTNSSSLV